LYAGLFSFTLVAFVAAMALKTKERRIVMGKTPENASSARKPWWLALFIVLAAVGLFYILAIKFAAVDWEHILSSVVAVVISSLILWSFLIVRRQESTYRPWVLALTAVLAVGLLTVFQAMASSRERLASELEQYSDYDPSFFAIQQTLKPA